MPVRFLQETASPLQGRTKPGTFWIFRSKRLPVSLPGLRKRLPNKRFIGGDQTCGQKPEEWEDEQRDEKGGRGPPVSHPQYPRHVAVTSKVRSEERGRWKGGASSYTDVLVTIVQTRRRLFAPVNGIRSLFIRREPELAAARLWAQRSAWRPCPVTSGRGDGFGSSVLTSRSRVDRAEMSLHIYTCDTHPRHCSPSPGADGNTTYHGDDAG